MKDFVTGDVRKRWELYFDQRVRKDRYSIRAHRFDISRGATTQGVNSATGSTGVDVNNRFSLGGYRLLRNDFFRARSGFFRRPFEFNGYKRL